MLELILKTAALPVCKELQL